MDDIFRIKTHFDNVFGYQMKEMWTRYTGEYAPINEKSSVSALKQESQLNVATNFVGSVVDTKTGYMGTKIWQGAETDVDAFRELFNEFLKTTSESVKTSENIRKASASGISHRLFYWKNGVPKIKVLDPWSVVYDYKDDMYDADKAYHYFIETDLFGNTSTYCDIYDRVNVTHYKLDGSNFVQIGEPEVHLSNQVPIIPFLNNDLMKGNCEKALSLIDGHDEIVSDYASEIKASRFAYMKIYGDLYTGVDSAGNPIDIPSYLREFGTMLFGLDDEGNRIGDAEYLSKTLDYQSILGLQKLLRAQIFEQSRSVDISEIIQMGANTRVFTIRAALMRLEADCADTEQFVKAALEKQFSLFMNWYSITFNVSIEATLHIEFNRVFPEDVEAKINALSQLKTSLSLADSLKYLGFEGADELAQRALEELGSSTGL